VRHPSRRETADKIDLIQPPELSLASSFAAASTIGWSPSFLEVGVAFFVGLALFIGLCGFLDARLPWPPRPTRQRR
jgi:hypothetical protein